jgi:hypothetical protein
MSESFSSRMILCQIANCAFEVVGERKCLAGSEIIDGTTPRYSGLYTLTDRGIRGGFARHVIQHILPENGEHRR